MTLPMVTFWPGQVRSDKQAVMQKFDWQFLRNQTSGPQGASHSTDH